MIIHMLWAWGDWDNDGDVDLVTGNYNQPNRIYENLSDNFSLIWSSIETDLTYKVDWADWDNDGDIDLTVGGFGGVPIRIYDNPVNDNLKLANSPTQVHITNPVPAVNTYATAVILEGPTIPITYTLSDEDYDPASFIEADYSLDGGSTWAPAVAAVGTITSNLAATPTGTTYVYNWDIYGSNVFGSSDNTIFRIKVYQGFGGDGPFYAFRSDQTPPFRLRGSQVRTLVSGGPVSGTVVFRQPADQGEILSAYRDQKGEPYFTNPAGYLQGYGALTIGDQLLAMRPVTETYKYTIYHTSASPTETGLDTYTVTSAGVQTLTVSAQNPLILFNLLVSLEWDARQDSTFFEPIPK